MINKFLDYVKVSPTQYQACENAEKMLNEAGFEKINESSKWNLKLGGKYYITRNNSSCIAFTIPTELSNLSFNITAAHLDSPTFKLKPNFTLDGAYQKLNTEVYGGPIFFTWMDRPLNIAGRVVLKTNEGIKTVNVSLDDAVCMIPNCSIHYYRELNTGVKFNPQIDLLPLISDKSFGSVDIYDLVANKLNINKEDIISSDLFLALLDRGMLVGANKEFIMAPQIDNLECSFACVESLINSTNNKSVNVCALFDAEEIGSRTRSGAASTMLDQVLSRVAKNLGLTSEDYNVALANSFIVSADNAQGYHPNYPGKFDPTNASHMNKGIVIKNAARGSYSTDGLTLAYFKSICDEVEAKVQLNTNRSDVPGGSTLGCISLGQVSIPSVDIGLPQIAMHSAYETAGRYDLDELIKALKNFYSKNLKISDDNTYLF